MRLIGIVFAALLALGGFVVGRQVGSSEVAVAVAGPMALSHFHCYMTNTPTQYPTIKATLKDQINGEAVTITKPDMLCVPTTKKLEGVPEHKFAGPADHLMCYHVTGKTVLSGKVYPVENQLGKSMARDFFPKYLCVPSHKFEPGTGG
jgi:hypothetical protein